MTLSNIPNVWNIYFKFNINIKIMQDEDLKIYKAIGKVLREARLERGMKFTIFCYENDISKSTLNNIENATKQTYFSKIAKVVSSLDMSYEEFGKLLDRELNNK